MPYILQDALPELAGSRTFIQFRLQIGTAYHQFAVTDFTFQQDSQLPVCEPVIDQMYNRAVICRKSSSTIALQWLYQNYTIDNRYIFLCGESCQCRVFGITEDTERMRRLFVGQAVFQKIEEKPTLIFPPFSGRMLPGDNRSRTFSPFPVVPWLGYPMSKLYKVVYLPFLVLPDIPRYSIGFTAGFFHFRTDNQLCRFSMPENGYSIFPAGMQLVTGGLSRSCLCNLFSCLVADLPG